MQKQNTEIEDLFILRPKVFEDERGFFMESWNEINLNELLGSKIKFVQDNHSRSEKGVLRGLHYQLENPQGKLVRVASGKVMDVIVDLRKDSPSFGKHIAHVLDDKQNEQIWIPPGCAHGFIVLSEFSDFLYKTTAYYYPKDEHTIRYDDPELGIDWLIKDPKVSIKDRQGKLFKDSKYYLA